MTPIFLHSHRRPIIFLLNKQEKSQATDRCVGNPGSPGLRLSFSVVLPFFSNNNNLCVLNLCFACVSLFAPFCKGT